MKPIPSKYPKHLPGYKKPNPTKEDIASNMINDWIEARKAGSSQKELDQRIKELDS